MRAMPIRERLPRAWLVAAVAVVGLLVAAAPARAQVPLSISVSDIDDSSPRVRAVLTVDRGGLQVVGLGADAVTVL